jgi:hypothetical protein
MPERDYRAEFIAKSQALGRGDSGRMDAIETAEVQEFQKRLDACSSPKEVFILKSQWAASNGGRWPGESSGNRTDSEGKKAGQQAGKYDPRSEFMAKLRAAGMGGGNERSEPHRREEKIDSVPVRKSVAHFDSSCGHLDFSGGEVAHFDSVSLVPGAKRVERFDEEGLRW